MNESESAAMWRLYARTEEAICIQSTYKRLRESLNEAPVKERGQLFLGTVEYIDYEGECLPDDNQLHSSFTKGGLLSTNANLGHSYGKRPNSPMVHR